MQSQKARFKGETEIAQPGLLLEISGEVPQELRSGPSWGVSSQRSAIWTQVMVQIFPS